MYGAELYETTKDLSGTGSARAIWTPTTGKRAVIGLIEFTVDAACTVTIYKTTNSEANLILKLKLDAYQGVSRELKIKEDCGADAVIYCTVSAGNITGVIKGWEK